MTSTAVPSSTIFALSSAPGRAGVAVIRVSGPAARESLGRLCAPASLPEPRTVALRTLRDPETGEMLDRAVVFWFAGPASETGEDVAEFQLHGGPAVVSAVLRALSTLPGCRLAEPGEFTRRAYLNGRLDLAEVEGLADLIHAETDAQRRQAMRQAAGAVSAQYDDWRAALIGAAALVEAAIDFSDEADVATSAFADARDRIQTLADDLRHHLDDGHRGEIVREGFRIALLGPPNAGKSSLLNALARRDAAIVSEEAGTTRDVIEVRLDLGGVPVLVSDTAGLRAAGGVIEQEGMRRSLAAGREAHLVLWLDPSGIGPADPCFDATVMESMAETISRETSLVIQSKIDLADSSTAGADHAISVKTGAGLDGLLQDLTDRAKAAAGDGTSAVVSQVRHRRHLHDALDALEAFLGGEEAAIELRAEDLRIAAASLGRITGRVDPEDVLDRIFSSFCIGK